VKQVINGGIWRNYNEMKFYNILIFRYKFFYNKSKNNIIF
jgi:hypothetical protein